MKKIICLIVLFFTTGCNVNKPSKGQKIGTIVKLSQEGLFYKTYEGELIRGSLTDGSGAFGGIFFFVIEDTNLVNKAKYAMENNKEVILIYHCEFISSLSRSEKVNPNFVDEIIIVE